MPVNWEPLIPDVFEQYIYGNLKAEATVEFLNNKHKTRITLRQFKLKWSRQKKLTAKEWCTIIPILKEREHRGIGSDVYLYGRHLPRIRVQRAKERYRNNRGHKFRSMDEIEPGRIEIRTPPEEDEETTTERDIDTMHDTPGDTIYSEYIEAQSQLFDMPLEAIDFMESIEFEGMKHQRSPSYLPEIYKTDTDALIFTDTSYYPQPLIQSFWLLEDVSRIFPQFQPANPLYGYDCCSLSTFDHKEESGWILARLTRWIPSFSILYPIAKQVQEVISQRRGQALPREKTSPESLKQIFFIVAYLASNNLLRMKDTHLFIEWVIANRLMGELSGFIRTYASRVSDICALASRVLEVKCLSRLSSDVHFDCSISWFRERPQDALDLLMIANPWIFKGCLGTQLLLEAAGSSNLEAVTLLLRRGVDINRSIKSEYGYWTALSRAIMRGSAETIKLLIDSGADANQPIYLDYGQETTALHLAIRERNLEAVRAILINPIKIQYNLHLMHCASRSSKEIYELITGGMHRKSADIKQLIISAGKGDMSLYKFLSEIEIPGDEILEYALLQAISENDVEAVTTLLRRGVDANAQKYRFGCLGTRRLAGAHDEHGNDDFVPYGYGRAHPLVVAMLHKSDGEIQGGEIGKNSSASKRERLVSLLLRFGAHFDLGELREEMDESGAEIDANLCFILDRAGYDVSVVGTSALTHAASEGSLYSCRALLQIGVEINNYDKRSGMTALHAAVDKANMALVDLLLDKGADVKMPVVDGIEWTEHQGLTALHIAARKGDVALVQCLVDWGADIDIVVTENGVDTKGFTALHIAARKGDVALMRCLLDLGANANMPAAECGGMTPLQAATYWDNWACIECLLDARADMKAPPAEFHGFTVLEAATYGRASMFRKLLARGAPVNRPKGGNGKLLHRLMNNDYLGVRLNARTQDRPPCFDGMTPLQRVTEYRNHEEETLENIHMALQAGARVEDRSPDYGDMTSLQVASSNLYRNVIQLLLDYGADVNAPAMGKKGCTALQAAVSSSVNISLEHHMETVTLLLGNRADVNAPACPEFGRTALQAAVSSEEPKLELVQLLLDHGADVNAEPAVKGGITAIQGAAIRGELQIVNVLLRRGANVAAPAAGEQGRTAIEGAAEHGRMEMVRLLLKWDPEAYEFADFSQAIRFARENRHWEIADLLQRSQDAFNPFSLRSPLSLPLVHLPDGDYNSYY